METNLEYSTLYIMHLAIVTPLYPPDIAGSAPYVKELGARLTKKGHRVTILAYSHIPEEITGVHIITTPKRHPLLIRMYNFTRELRALLHQVDYILVENGPSTELPLFLASFGYRQKVTFHLFDRKAEDQALNSLWYRIILYLGLSGSGRILTHTDLTLPYSERTTLITRPHTRPEILPFTPYPEKEYTEYEASWNEHLQTLETLWDLK